MKNMLDNLLKKNKKSNETNFDILTNDDFTHLTSDTSEVTAQEKSLMRNSTGGSFKNYSTSTYETRQKKLPLIGELPIKKQYQIITVVGVLGLLIIGGGAFTATVASRHAFTMQEHLYASMSNSQSLYTAFEEAVVGDKEGFEKLEKDAKELDELIKKVNAEDDYLGVSSKNSEIEGRLKKLNQLSAELSKNAIKFKEQESLLKDVTTISSNFEKDIDRIGILLKRLGVIQRQVGADQNQIILTMNVLTQLKALTGTFNSILLSDKLDQAKIGELKRLRESIKSDLIDIYNGNIEKGIDPINAETSFKTFNELSNKWIEDIGLIDNVISDGEKLFEVKKLGNLSSEKAMELSTEAKEVITKLDAKFTKHIIGYLSAAVGLLLLLSAILSAIYAYVYEKENKSLLEKVEANKNQQAILRLLDELGPISEGDLSKATTVTEEITGAIADSINMTISDLAGLVKKIKQSAENIKIKAEEANEISRSMLEENIRQAESIKETGEKVLDISYAVNEISEKTAESAKVANESVEVSVLGATSVSASIESMNTIKVNIHDTGLLMKKLNDSSRQISEIIELLSDISEETSVLALNASVQAAKAGEAGKGFTIVANSIQELAAKASDSTRKVGALVSTIQTDINAVGDSLVKTTSEVQKGTKLSEEAGEALTKIQEVSDSLSGIIKTISEETKRHAEVANKVSIDIKEMLVASGKAEEANIKTADVIREIASLSNSLDKATQHFKVE